jgi:hypothetical protein
MPDDWTCDANEALTLSLGERWHRVRRLDADGDLPVRAPQDRRGLPEEFHPTFTYPVRQRILN